MTSPTHEEITALLELEARWRSMPHDYLDEQEARDCVGYSLDEAARTLVRPLAEAYLDMLDARESAAPIDMVLHCPSCGRQHIDEPAPGWDNPQHKSHLCNGCGSIWRPADIPTNGVVAVKTVGKADHLAAPGNAALAKIEALEGIREPLIDLLTHLIGAHDLLSRSSKKSAPSDKMFDQMLVDHKCSIERGRVALFEIDRRIAELKVSK